MNHESQYRVVWTVGVAVAIAMIGPLLFPQLAWACPNCKEALANDAQQGGDLVQGFFWSILFMMSMPFAILGTFSGYMYYEVRKARGSRREETSSPPTDEGPVAS